MAGGRTDSEVWRTDLRDGKRSRAPSSTLAAESIPSNAHNLHSGKFASWGSLQHHVQLKLSWAAGFQELFILGLQISAQRIQTWTHASHRF
jgi:hypothetical protein